MSRRKWTRLLAMALLIAIAAYGWQRTARQRAQGTHEIVAVNRSGRPLEAIRIRIGGRHLDVASLRQGASAKLPLLCESDDTFDLSCRAPGSDSDRHWSGGSFHTGPVRMRHRFEFVGGDGVVWRTEQILPIKGKARSKRARARA